jgi:hypothetical protein
MRCAGIHRGLGVHISKVYCLYFRPVLFGTMHGLPATLQGPACAADQ